MRLLIATTIATLVACGESYEEATPPEVDIPDAGTPDATADADRSDSSGRPIDAASPPNDAGADADANIEDPDAGWPFADPSFQATDRWLADGGAELQPGGQGAVDLGLARLVSTKSPFGFVSQTTILPVPKAEERPALRLVHFLGSNEYAFGSVGVFADGQPLGLYLEGTYVERGLRRDILCLGEGAWSPTPRSFAFRSLGEFFALDLDSVEYLPNAACPAPGVIENSGFETSGGWQLARSNPPGRYDVGTGVGGSRSLRMQQVYADELTAATQRISVPKTSMAAPALRFHQSGAGIITMKLDGARFAATRTTGPDEVKTVCFPSWARGTAPLLGIALGGDRYRSGGDEVPMVVHVDDVSIVNDLACALPAHENRDFEDLDPRILGWQVYSGSNGYSVTRRTGGAHSGNAYVTLATTGSSCGISDGQAHVLTHYLQPPHDRTTGGVRVSFHYRYPDEESSVPRINQDNRELPAAATWTRYSFCGAPGPVNTLHPVEIALVTTLPCGESHIDIDDIEIDTDLSCPIE